MKTCLGHSRISVLASDKVVPEHIKWGDAEAGVQGGSVPGTCITNFLTVCSDPGRRPVQVWGEAFLQLSGFGCSTKLQLKL